MRRLSAVADRPAEFPDEGPMPELEPSEPTTLYVLPIRWSLYFALTEKQWGDLRARHKKLDPEWEHCGCPKRCKANTFDERWSYDNATHIKTFCDAAFICGGCHWLKSATWRVETWLKQQDGLLPVMSKPPHIIDCLGWTQEQIDALRDRDLKRHQAQTAQRARLDQQVQQGKAAIVPGPPERLPPQDLERLVKPGQIMVVPWRVDLSALVRYGYSQSEIAIFEQRMYQLAAKRMAGDDGGGGGRGSSKLKPTGGAILVSPITGSMPAAAAAAAGRAARPGHAPGRPKPRT
jgi:hypothetical protein